MQRLGLGDSATPVQMTRAARAQVMQCGKCERVQEASATQWVRALPAVALRKAGSLQKAHQPSLESMLAAQVASGTAVCSHDKVATPCAACLGSWSSCMHNTHHAMRLVGFGLTLLLVRLPVLQPVLQPTH